MSNTSSTNLLRKTEEAGAKAEQEDRDPIDAMVQVLEDSPEDMCQTVKTAVMDTAVSSLIDFYGDDASMFCEEQVLFEALHTAHQEFRNRRPHGFYHRFLPPLSEFDLAEVAARWMLWIKWRKRKGHSFKTQ